MASHVTTPSTQSRHACAAWRTYHEEGQAEPQEEDNCSRDLVPQTDFANPWDRDNLEHVQG